MTKMFALARMFFGLLMKISKQSAITTVFVPKCFSKHMDVVFHICSLHDHLITGFRCKNNTSITFKKALEAIELLTLKQ